MNKEYIIGVDGGGTKTDYLLFTTKGEWVDSYRVGSRSHEVVQGGFAKVEKLILSDIEYLLSKNNIDKTSVVAAAFGMAGIDTLSQLETMNKIILKAELQKFVVANDSILGIKAGCPSGVGICSINGTGTVALGINSKGEMLQVGGIGLATGDHAGGFIISSLVIRSVYDYYFRCGAKTILSERIMDLFGIENPKYLFDAISNQFYTNRDKDKEVVTILFNAVLEEDEVAKDIVREVANELAKSVAGCMKQLHFEETPEVVLAGSIWTKANCPLLLQEFKEVVKKLANVSIDPIPLKVIPAAGAIIWALELAFEKPITLQQREKILNNEAIQNL